MATLARTDLIRSAPIGVTTKSDNFIERHLPRRCMVFSVGLILAGLGIVLLMLLEMLPLSLWLFLAGLLLSGTGVGLALYFYGEI